MKDLRTKRVESLIQEEVARLIVLGEVKDPRVNSFLSLNTVRVSKDLSLAKIYVSSFEGERKTLEGVAGLNSAAGFLQGVLGKKFHMRSIPKLAFFPDDSIEEGFRINRVIDSIVSHENE